MSTENATMPEKKRSEPFERIGDSLYRRGGVIFARVRVNGRRPSCSAFRFAYWQTGAKKTRQFALTRPR